MEPVSRRMINSDSTIVWIVASINTNGHAKSWNKSWNNKETHNPLLFLSNQQYYSIHNAFRAKEGRINDAS